MAKTLGFEWLVALRFLREGRMQTLLIIVGVAAGVAARQFPPSMRVMDALSAAADAAVSALRRSTYAFPPSIAKADIPISPRIENTMMMSAWPLSLFL